MTREPYNYNDMLSGRTDALTQALDKCERLEKQLKIATEELKTAINLACPYEKSLNNMFDSIKTIQKNCGIALQQIKKLEKQSNIAVEALKNLTNSDNWSVEQVDGEHVFCFNTKYPWRFTGEALKKIKDL